MNNFFTEASLKKYAVMLVVLFGGVGIGSYAVYQYNLQQKLAITEAKTELIRNQLQINQKATEELPPAVSVPAPDNTAVTGASGQGVAATPMGHSVIVTNRTDLISVDRAKEIAAATIGVSIENMSVYEIELDHKQGKIKYKHGYEYTKNPHYMIKCAAKSLYYKIQIDAVDGRVLEVDIDD